MAGYIKLYRSLSKWEWYTDNNTKIVFLHCLLKANFKDQKYRGIVIERGSFITGYELFSNEINLSIQKIRTSFNKLKSTSELTIKSTRNGTIVTICNYDTYQDLENESNKKINGKVTTEQQESNKKVTTLEEGKKVISNKKTSKKDFDMPDWISEESWKGFVEMRNKMKKPLTERAVAGIINKLECFGKEKANGILDQSTERCWTTVYEIKEDYSNNKNAKSIINAEVNSNFSLESHSKEENPF